MREILFRGKRIDNGKWIDGFAVIDKPYYAYVFVPTGTEENGTGTVHISTIGQFTGLTANSKKIFEDDIIRSNHDGAVGVVRFGEYMSPCDPDHTRHIGYYVDWQGEDKDYLRADLGYWASRSDVEVVGNIHDNPELLEDKP